MKLARFNRHGDIAWGIVEDGTIYSLVGDLYGNFRRGIELGPLAEVQLLAPAEPSIIVACGLNYIGEAKKLGAAPSEEPSIFFKPVTTLVDPDGDVVYPTISQELAHEGELCCVIKQTARNVPQSEALDYVLGYTCGNDLTRAKGFDTASPLGPFLVTDLDPHNLSIKARINGQTIQDSNTGEMIHSVERIISHITEFMTLRSGDIIFTGTPEGGHYPVKVGDVMEVEIEDIGILKNQVVAPR
jgi:2-keto-4-pentenoate hydratase/2-oxohepta-3-ene-1,7-dioic acid hydratase in catechol pathway